MKKALRLIASIEILFHLEAGEKKVGPCSGLSGDCSGLSGDCSGLRGDCSGLRGNCSGLRGDVDMCDLADKDRKAGVDIASLVGPDPDVDEKGGAECS